MGVFAAQRRVMTHTVYSMPPPRVKNLLPKKKRVFDMFWQNEQIRINLRNATGFPVIRKARFALPVT